MNDAFALAQELIPGTRRASSFGASGVFQLDMLSQASCAAAVARLDERTDWKTSIFPEGAERGRQFISVEPGLFGLPASFAVELGLERHFSFALHRAICARYGEGDRFGLHSDGPSTSAEGTMSTHTLMVYLSEVEGGETYFIDFDLAIAPRRGVGLIFAHDLRHAALPVRNGVKYILHAPLFPARSVR